jgi:hypothetical protein
MILASLLAEVATRASQLNDDKLNSLMCRLTLYEISDPYSKEYDEELSNKIKNMVFVEKEKAKIYCSDCIHNGDYPDWGCDLGKEMKEGCEFKEKE